MKSFEFRPAAEKVISFEYNYSLTMVAILLKALRFSKGHMKNIYGFSRWSSLFYWDGLWGAWHTQAEQQLQLGSQVRYCN